MPRKANNASRAAAIEGIRWYFSNERPSGPPLKPFFLTYLGDDVVTLTGVGKFAKGTRANVSRACADQYRDDPEWRVEAVPKKKTEED